MNLSSKFLCQCTIPLAVFIASSTYASPGAAVIPLDTKLYVIPVSDLNPPVRTNGLPTGLLQEGTTEVELSVDTDETAECRFAKASQEAGFEQMDPFSVTNSTAHNSLITGLEDGEIYSYSVRCQDTYGNTNQDNYTVSFTIAGGNNTGPRRFNGSPTGILDANTTETMLSLNTDVKAECRYKATWPGLTFDTMTPFAGINSTFHYKLIPVQADEEDYSFSVRCKNSATGATNTDNYNITFSVGGSSGGGAYDCSNVSDTGPIRCNGQPVGVLPSGTIATFLEVNTFDSSNSPLTAECRYAPNADNLSFDTMTPFNATNVTLHRTSITGLEDGMTYNYSVRCSDSSGNTNQLNYNIPFSIASSETASTENR